MSMCIRYLPENHGIASVSVTFATGRRVAVARELSRRYACFHKLLWRAAASVMCVILRDEWQQAIDYHGIQTHRRTVHCVWHGT